MVDHMIKRMLLIFSMVLLSPVAQAAPQSAEAYANRGMDLYHAGDYPGSAAAYEKALELGADDPVLHYNAACSYALGGHADDAFRHLQIAFEAGYYDADATERDPDLASLHGDSRWPRFLEAMRLAKWRNELRWNSTAFRTAYTDKLSDEEKIAGLSRVWAEAKYGFANFDIVPALDWDARYVEFLSRVRAAPDTYTYYRELMQFVAALQDGHSGIVPPSALWNRFARPGLRTSLIEGRVIVREVGDNRARGAGVGVGQELLAVNGIPVLQYAERHVKPYISASTPQDRDVRVFDYQLLAGDLDEPVLLDVRGTDGSARKVQVDRLPLDQHQALRPAPFEMDWLENDIALVKLNSFENRDVVVLFETAFKEIKVRARGLIIDVRDNGGGSSDIGYTVLAHLTDRPFATTTWSSPAYTATFRAWGQVQRKEGPHDQDWQPARTFYAGPVAVLTGPRTYSAAEDFAVAFDQMNRGVLIGETTGGSTGQPLMFDLPGGGRGRICTKRDRYRDGTEFVGVGVLPDIRVPTTIASLRDGRDLVLERAIEWLVQQG